MNFRVCKLIDRKLGSRPKNAMFIPSHIPQKIILQIDIGIHTFQHKNNVARNHSAVHCGLAVTVASFSHIDRRTGVFSVQVKTLPR